MPRFACPDCKKVMSATEEERGTVKACPECGKKVRVPAVKGVVKPAPANAEENEETAPTRKARPVPEVREEVRTPEKSPRRPAPTEDDADDSDDEAEEPRHRKNHTGQTGVAMGFFGLLGALLALGIFILVVSGRWVPLVWEPLQKFLQDQGIPEFVAIGVTGILVLIPVGLFFAANTKSTILGAMPVDLDFRPAKLSSFKEMDEDQLGRLTAAIEGLGFTRLIDYTISTELEMSHKGFGRLFVHPEKHCFAEINVVFRAGGDAIPMRCNFSSYLGDGWSVSVGNRTPTKENYLFRRPRAVWRSFPDEPPKKLFAELLKLRSQMADALGVEVLDEDDTDLYFSREKIAARERKDVVRRRWSLGIALEFWLFDRKPKREWLGEYARRAR